MVQEVGSETLVYDLRTHKAKCLNETSAAIWKLCDGEKDAIGIAIALSAELKANVSEDLIWLAFDELEKEELFDGPEREFGKFDGLSRREVVRKVGFAAVIALPIINSIVSPLAANAQSFNVVACINTPADGPNCCCDDGLTPSGAPICPGGNGQDASCQGACDANKVIFCAGVANPGGDPVCPCTDTERDCEAAIGVCPELPVPGGSQTIKCCAPKPAASLCYPTGSPPACPPI